jgi:hypothetical protein
MHLPGARPVGQALKKATNAAIAKRTRLTKIFGLSLLLAWKNIETGNMIARMTAATVVIMGDNSNTPGRINPRLPMNAMAATP